MNKIYRLIFDKRRGELVVVSEITAGLGKSGTTAQVMAPSSGAVRLGKLRPAVILMGSLLGMLPVHHVVRAATLLPTGGQVVVGVGNISSSGSTMTVTQGSQKLGANWNTFDIGQGSSVVFVQPDSSAVALNRVTGGGGASQIMGTLTANGQVFLLNPNGVLVGKGGQVSTAGFVASTQSLSDGDFAGGNITLSGAGSGSVVNQGNITGAQGGYVVLSGAQVRNEGSITTPGGRAVLTAADQVTLSLDGSGLAGVSVNGAVVNALVKNQGLIVADNGQVQLTARGKDMLLNEAVNNSGIIQAQGLSSHGGSIVLDGGDNGVVTQAGALDVSSAGGQDGKVTLEGRNIHLTTGSRINATGQAGGGEVYVGGGWQGKDSSITHANALIMDEGAVIDVSATGAGDGGTAVLWSDNYTSFRGNILAKGGGSGGNGGQVETSSHNNLQAFGGVDAGAVNGKAGDWLLDPVDVTIVSSATANNTASGGIWTPKGNNSLILNTSINNELNNGTGVTVLTNGTNVSGQMGNITVNADITKTKGGDSTLNLLADGNINITNHNITSSSGALNIKMTSGRTTANTHTAISGSNISTNGGDVFISYPGSGVNVSINASSINAGGGNIGIYGASSGAALAGIYINNSALAGNNITLMGTSVNTLQGVQLLGNVSVSALDTLNITGVTSGYGATGISVDYGNIALSGSKGVIISGSSAQWMGVYLCATGSVISDRGNIKLVSNGTSGASGKGLQLLGNPFDVTARMGSVTIISDLTTELSGVNVSGSHVVLGGMNNFKDVSVTGSTDNNASAIIVSGNIVGNNTTISGAYTGVSSNGQNVSGVLLSNANLSGVTVNGSSVYLGTTGVTFAGSNTLDNTQINGYSESGTNSVLVTGMLKNKNNVIINANASNSLALGISSATIYGGTFKASSLTGSGFYIENSVLNNAQVSGSSNSIWSYGGYFGAGGTLNNSVVTGSSTSIGVALWGNLNMTGSSYVTGNSVNSTGVDIFGTVSGGNISGHSVNSYGVKISGSNTSISNVKMTAITDSWAASSYPVDQEVADSAIRNTEIVQKYRGVKVISRY